MSKSTKLLVCIVVLASTLLYWGLQHRTEEEFLEIAKFQFTAATKSNDSGNCFRYEKSQIFANGRQYVWYKTWKNSKDTIRIVIVVNNFRWESYYWYEDGNTDLLYKLAQDRAGTKNIDGLPEINRRAMIKYAKYDICKDSI